MAADENIAAARSALKALGEIESYLRVEAPFDGVVTRRGVSPGDLVQGATASRSAALFTVQQIDTVRVFCEVPEGAAGGVVVGAEADVKLFGLAGQIVKGKVTRLANAIDPTTRTMRAEIDLPNASGVLRPGMYAQVTIKVGPPARVTEGPGSSH